MRAKAILLAALVSLPPVELAVRAVVTDLERIFDPCIHWGNADFGRVSISAGEMGQSHLCELHL